jgi:hypothetical protein
MTRLKVLCGVAVLLLAAVGVRYLWRSGVGDHHTVDWYLAHEDERHRVWRLCANDHALDLDPDCRNALSAEKGAFAKQMRDNIDPKFWDDDAKATQNAPARAAQ